MTMTMAVAMAMAMALAGYDYGYGYTWLCLRECTTITFSLGDRRPVSTGNNRQEITGP